MKYKFAALVFAGACIFFLRTASSQSAGSQAPAAADFKPGFDDLMTMLIQPRHMKLFYSGTGNNWEMAAFELRELRSAFQRAAQSTPTYLNNDVQTALQTFMEPKIQAVAAAIKTGNQKQFASSYAELPAGCNACHAYMEHPFLVIKVPDSPISSAYADQAFGK